MDLAGALGLGSRELVSFVGAGGKKTAMAHLTAEAVRRDLRAGYATTTHAPPPADLPLVVASAVELADALESAPESVAFARERVEEPERAARKVRGHAPAAIDAVFDRDRFDWLLVKADGARRREFKAPGADEPAIPTASTHVVPVASVRAVGQPLDEGAVHRPERVAAITGLEPGAEITAPDVGAVLASDDGGCRDVPEGATVTPIVNKADTRTQRETGREVLRAVLARSETVTRGLVCSFTEGHVERVDE